MKKERNLLRSGKLLATIGLLLGLSASPTFAQSPDSTSSPQELTLDAAIRIALTESTKVRIGDMEVQKQQYSLNTIYGKLFPSLSFSANYSYTIRKQVMYLDGFPGASQMPPEMMEKGIEIGRTHNLQAGLSAGLPLVNVALWESISLGKDAVELTLRKAQSSRIDKVCEVKKAFYTALLAKDTYDVIKKSYDNGKSNYEQICKLYAQGLVAKYDMISGEVRIKNLEPTLLEAANRKTLTRKALLILIGLDPDTELSLKGELTDFESEASKAYFSGQTLSIEGNSMLRELEMQRQMQQKNLKLAKYSFIPTISFGLKYNYSFSSNKFNLDNDRLWTPFSALNITFSFPLLEGGSRYFKIKQEQLALSQLDLSRRDAERQLTLGMQQYSDQLVTAIQSLGAAENAVKAAEQGYTIAEKRYETGEGTLLEVNDANVALLQARLNYNQAIFSFMQARAEMDRIAGKGLPDEADSNTNQQK